MMDADKSAQHFFGGAAMIERLSLLPSEYFARNCYLGSSPLRLAESQMRHQIGVDRIMWGNDFPHIEGTYPYALEALRYVLSDVPDEEVSMIVADTANDAYGLDRHALTAAAAKVGPTLSQLREPLLEVPTDSLSAVFIAALVQKNRELHDARRA